MKVVILAGGLGTRISEESILKPKPLIEIGSKPILWHIMKLYSHYQFNDFIICCGYKGYMIKEFFFNYYMHLSDMSIDLQENKTVFHRNSAEPWKVTLIDTGENTQTGGRIGRIKKYLDDDKDEEFCMTYGDGVSNVNISELLNFHREKKKLATMTVTQPPGRFGSVDISDDKINKFLEKPEGDGGWINAGFFVLNKKVLEYIKDDATVWEQEPLRNLATKKQLAAFKHQKFWQPMDTFRDKTLLENLWNSAACPWRLWKD
jgi:glucose-1-phosphate cytidylyltransferase